MDHVLNLYQPNNSHLINTTTNQQLQQNSQSASNNLVLMSQGSNKNSSAPLAMDVDPTLSLSSLISHTNNHSRTTRVMGGGIGLYPSSLINVPQSLLNSSSNAIGSRTSQSLMSNSSFAPTSLPLDLGSAGVQNIGLLPGAVELHPMHSYQAHHTSSGSASFVPHTVGSSSSNNNGSNNPADSDESPMVGVCVQQSPVVIH